MLEIGLPAGGMLPSRRCGGISPESMLLSEILWVCAELEQNKGENIPIHNCCLIEQVAVHLSLLLSVSFLLGLA